MSPARPKLLSGGNPQIPKGDGEAPVRAYLDAVPGWKQRVAEDVDRLVARTIPGVRKAVKYNSPLYGVVPGTWFLSLHCFTGFLRLTFFDGAALEPPPAGPSRLPRVRYHDVSEDAPVDEALLARWIRQAARLPGERL